MPYTSHTGGFSPRAYAPVKMTDTLEDITVPTIEAAFDHDTAQGVLFPTREDHLAAAFRPRVMTVRVTPNEFGGGVSFIPGASFEDVGKLIEVAIEGIKADAERQARRQFAVQLADHLAGIRS